MLTISFYVLTFIMAAVAIFGDTWHKGGRLTRWDKAALLIALFIIPVGIGKELQAKRETSGLQTSLDRINKSEYTLREGNSRLQENNSNLRKEMHEEYALISALIGKILGSPDANSRERLAALAIDNLFSLERPSVVRIYAKIGGAVRRKSGFFISPSGAILTASYAVAEGARQASEISVECADRKRYPAKIVKVDPTLSIAVLTASVKPTSYLRLNNTLPSLGEQILIMGSTDEWFLARARGRISQIEGTYDLYSRDQNFLPGFGGGPIIDTSGSVIGVNWGALEPPQPGFAKFSRMDRILPILDALKIAH
jgi:S1-C subfamily serine protease